mmetsp:Transcript_12508/g.27363  ORF Transcript_12508/g.27363 Transcript_12508/m.27363 type:complete len:180 (+) Transcript_12508:48-587(+)
MKRPRTPFSRPLTTILTSLLLSTSPLHTTCIEDTSTSNSNNGGSSSSSTSSSSSNVGSSNNIGVGGCRIIMDKNEWAAGCIPAVNFVVKLVDCGDGVAMSDVTVRFIDENNKELGRDYFVAPLGQCTVTGYGNIKTITPRGGNNVYMVASCDLCGGKVNVGGSLMSVPMPINGQVTDCF